MGDRDDGLFPETTEVLEKKYTLDIQVVGWFIEDEYIYFLYEKFCYLYLCLFTSRELCDGSVEIGLIKSEIGENF